MDNRSIAAFIETNKTRMKSVIICLPSKGSGQEKRIRYKDYKKKEGGADQGKEVGVKTSLSLEQSRRMASTWHYQFM